MKMENEHVSVVLIGGTSKYNCHILHVVCFFCYPVNTLEVYSFHLTSQSTKSIFKTLFPRLQTV